jgi:uncharacterized membrane protein YwaF
MSKTDGYRWTLKPGNNLFFTLLSLFLLFLTVLSAALRKESETTRRIVLTAMCVFTTAGFFVYKYYLSIDDEYSAIKVSKGMGEFNWWGELPLHLCNINMLFIPFAVLFRIRPLEAFCFFSAPLGALMALIMPGKEFKDRSIFLPRMFGFFGTHFMILIEGLAMTTFDLYRPAFSDIFPALLTALLILFCISVINMLMRWTGLYPNANYFFSIETEGNFFLEIFHKWIPVPFLYLTPCILILAVYMVLFTGLYSLFSA